MYRAKRVENDVTGMPEGVSFMTLLKAWESVTTSFGVVTFDEQSRSSSGFRSDACTQSALQ